MNFVTLLSASKATDALDALETARLGALALVNKGAGVVSDVSALTGTVQQMRTDLKQASTLALELTSLNESLDMLDRVNQLENGLLLLNGYAVTTVLGLRVIRVSTGGPLAFRVNADGTTTIVSIDPSLFGVRVNADNTQTLYRS